MDDDYPEMPEFLNRKTNGIESANPNTVRIPGMHGQKLIAPPKRNWRKIEKRRREQAKKEGTSLSGGSMRQRKGQ